MEFGIQLTELPVDLPVAEHFDAFVRQVEAAQRNGLTSAHIGQHFLFPGQRWLQPVPLLARLAGEVDKDFKLVTQIVVSPLYHPVLLAEELATLDIVTEGRLRVGLGVGYQEREFSLFGVPFEERVARFEEGLELMRALWTSERVDFEGRFWQLDGVHTHIRPVQQPHPPIWLAAQTPAGVRRAARLGDTWVLTPHVTEDELRAKLEIFTRERLRVGKPLPLHPLPRYIVIDRNRDAARQHAIAVSQDWYAGMGSVGTLNINVEAVESRMAEIVNSHWVLGTVDDCAQQLRTLVDTYPVDPIIVRPQWRGMTADDAVAYLDELGAELVPSLRGYDGVREFVLPDAVG